MDKILIVGANGMLGNALAKKASETYSVTGTYNSFVIQDAVKLDITKKAEVDRLVSEIKPVLTVNCAAITNVDLCEENPHLAELVHVAGTKNLSEACARNGSKFVHVSTDFVFSGSKGNYSESDVPHPVNIYGKTKLDGEKETRGDDLVIRTCIFGKNVEPKKSMVEWIVGELSAGKQIGVFSDSFFTPVYTGHLAEIILQGFEKDLTGLFHVGSSDRVDKFSFAKAVAEIYGLDSGLIKPSSISSFSRKAKRPADTSLVSAKIVRHGVRLNDFKDEIRMMKNDRQ